MAKASKDIQKYFSDLTKDVNKCYDIANEARSKNLDPMPEPEIMLAHNMAERVIGLVSMAAPQLLGTKIPERIQELEKEYGTLDWRVGFKIAEEVAKEQFCKFNDKKEAMEVGIRTGFAYLTLGIVAAPLEGFIGIEIKKRQDGKEYFALKYAGPIRGAGGTAASTSVILSDYVRVKMGYATYDPDETEIKRYVTEVNDYHERVTNLQYRPSDEELKFMVSHLPVEVDGDPTERIEVSNFKDLSRISTNMIRGGVALVLAEGLCQKSPKLWKRISKWGKDFDLEWDFISEFLKLKEKIHAAHDKKEDKYENKKEKKKITVKANDTFISDLVAGRPVLTHPLAEGGFRLRYGRGRTSGFSASAVHPATLVVLDKYIAIGTQLKTERPGKATTITLCDTLEGPVVKLEDGSVIKLNSEEEAKRVVKNIIEVIFLGDILFNYGDFSENGQKLVPAGYCPEWWSLEVRKKLNEKDKDSDKAIEELAKNLDLDPDKLTLVIKKPLFNVPSFDEAIKISKFLKVALHPEHTYYWKLIALNDFNYLKEFLKLGKLKKEEEGIKKIILPYSKENRENEKVIRGKRTLELLGIEHQVINNESVVLERAESKILITLLNIKDQNDLADLKPSDNKHENALEALNSELENKKEKVSLRDKAGTFVGARMGRPEKAKMRSMKGKPHGLFPVGEEGDRLRCFQSALKAGKVTADFQTFRCKECNKNSIYRTCEECGEANELKQYCRTCGIVDKETCRHGNTISYKKQEIDIKYYFDKAIKRLGERVYPDLIKGIKGTSNKEHFTEHLAKGILRAKHNVYVNKDGTTRYDCTELPLTHFKPKEIGTSVEKLKKLGYKKDIEGQELANDNQILELKPQDVIMPGVNMLEDSAIVVLKNVANFVDDMLVRFYGMKPFYKIKKDEDLIGHLIIGLAPHISAGTVGRIVGFSQTQGMIAHPMYHAGLRRDCFSYDTYLPILTREGWQIRKIGELIEELGPRDVVDNFGTKEIKVNNFKTLGKDLVVKINNFTKHAQQTMVKIKTASGKVLTTTYNHKHLVFNNNSNNFEKIVLSKNLKIGDCLALPYNFKIPKKDIKHFDLIDLLKDQEWVMVRGINEHYNIKEYARKHFDKRGYDNYTLRNSYPIKFAYELKKKGIITSENLFVAAKRDTVSIPAKLKITKELLQLIGLYIAEGYSRKIKGMLYQTYIAAQDKEMRKFIRSNVKNIFGLVPSENKTDRLTYSSRIIYHFFTSILKCGSGAYEKRFPEMMLNLPNKKLGYILSGYFEGDGSVSKSDTRVTFDTVSEGLLKDLDFVFGQLGIFVKNYKYKSLPGKQVQEFYIRKNREIPEFIVTKGIIQSIFVKKFSKYVGFISTRKSEILKYLLNKKTIGIRQKLDSKFVYDKIVVIEILPAEESYCLNVPGNKVIANSILSKQCDGDEAAGLLLLDGLINFSKKFLPSSRGSTMDAPLVLTATLAPSEVDDQVLGMEMEWEYPLEFYEAAAEMKAPWDVKYGPDQKKIVQLADQLDTENQYEGFGFTHHVNDFNKGVQCSAYKILPTMKDKLFGQMDIAKKVRAVDLDHVAMMVVQKHFLSDIKGNLRKYSMQKFRCPKCNAKYRRPPLSNKCTTCNNPKLIFTISEGSVIKYLEPSLELTRKYEFSPYLKETIEILEKNVIAVFGKEKEKQAGLGEFMS